MISDIQVEGYNGASEMEKKTSKVIRISDVVNDYLQRQRQVGENPDDVLRRLFSLPVKQNRRSWK